MEHPLEGDQMCDDLLNGPRVIIRSAGSHLDGDSIEKMIEFLIELRVHRLDLLCEGCRISRWHRE